MLYHADVYIPERIQSVLATPRTLPISYSLHAQQAAQEDRYGVITLPTYINTADAKLVEVETDEAGKLVKIVYRVPHDEMHDLVMPLACNNGRIVAKTVWLNRRDDEHRTLRVDRYAKA